MADQRSLGVQLVDRAGVRTGVGEVYLGVTGGVVGDDLVAAGATVVGRCCEQLPEPLLVTEVRFSVSSVSLVIDIVTWVAQSAPTQP